jgi:hypothetical protein
MASIVAMSYGSHISHSSGIPPPMKTPIKPFLVEVKRSRSISSPKDAVRLERPVVVEASAPAASTTHSQTRQLAERAFKALAAGSSDERGHIATAQSVFAPRPKSDAVPQIAQTDLVTPDPMEQTVITKEVVSSKPRKPRPPKASVKAAAGAFGFEANVPGSVPAGAASNIAPSAGRQEPPPLVETVHVQGVEASEPGTEAPLKADIGQSDQRRFGHNPLWGPGERWKRRLRHLRLA